MIGDAETSRKASNRLFDHFEVDSSEGEQESWLMTYLDMMTLLLVMLVVLLAFSSRTQGLGQPDQTLQPAVARPSILPPLFSSPRIRESAATTPRFDGLGDDVDVLIGENTVRLRVSNEILFASGQATLTALGRTVLGTVADAIRAGGYDVAVEGHTDDVSISTARFPSNWELSTARATSVVRLLLDAGIEPSRLRATGYAETRPLRPNDDEEARAANRRVELILEVSGTKTEPTGENR